MTSTRLIMVSLCTINDSSTLVLPAIILLEPTVSALYDFEVRLRDKRKVRMRKLLELE